MDIYMGPEASKGKEGNWRPTAKGSKFFMLFRFYGAGEALFTKTWQLNDEENCTPRLLKALQVSLVEPVAYLNGQLLVFMQRQVKKEARR